MEELKAAISEHGEVLGDGLLGVGAMINHRVDPLLMDHCGSALASAFADQRPNLVLTVESSGIPPALMTARHLSIDMVYARTKRPATLASDVYTTRSRSHTKGNVVTLHVAADRMAAGARVLIIDDFLGSGGTVLGLARLIDTAGATLVGVGVVVEKVYEGGRADLAELGVPIVSLAAISELTAAGVTFVSE